MTTQVIYYSAKELQKQIRSRVWTAIPPDLYGFDLPSLKLICGRERYSNSGPMIELRTFCEGLELIQNGMIPNARNFFTHILSPQFPDTCDEQEDARIIASRKKILIYQYFAFPDRLFKNAIAYLHRVQHDAVTDQDHQELERLLKSPELGRLSKPLEQLVSELKFRSSKTRGRV